MSISIVGSVIKTKTKCNFLERQAGMNIKLNFIQDWHDQLKGALANCWGVDVSEIRGRDIPIAYFNAELRRISSRPREIKVSDIFNCPTKFQPGWDNIQKDVLNGNDMTPYLSKKVDCIDYKDPMLNDWGVHHLHLGYNQGEKFVNRTGSLLFCLVTDNCLYVINIYSHGEWANSDIIEVIHRNWPDVIRQYAINGDQLSCNNTEEHIKTLRKKCCNSLVQMPDGTIYLPVGGGVTCSGHNVQSILMMDRQHLFLKQLEQTIKEQYDGILPELVNQGYDGESELAIKLKITETKYIAIFPTYDFEFMIMRKQ